MILFALAVLLHGGLYFAALSEQSYLTDDSVQYLRLADNLAAEGTFSQAYLAPYVPDVQRTPGYPVFLLLLGRWVPLVLLVQHLLSLCTAALLWRIFRPLIGGKGALLCGWSYALMPYPAIFASVLLSETLFIFLLVLAFVCLVRAWEDARPGTLALGMLALALACMVRPVAWPLMIAVAGFTLSFATRAPRLRKLGMLAALVIPFLIPAMWMARSHAICGKWSLSTMGDLGMLHGRLGGLEAYRQGLQFNEHTLYMRGDSIAALQTGLPALRRYYSGSQTHETELYAAESGRITMGAFLEQPGLGISFQLKNLGMMLGGVGWGWGRQVTGSPWVAGSLAILQLAWNLLMYAGALLGLLSIRRWGRWQWLAWAITGLTLLVSAAAWADGRYRVVIDPFLLALAVAALVAWRSRVKATA